MKKPTKDLIKKIKLGIEKNLIKNLKVSQTYLDTDSFTAMTDISFTFNSETMTDFITLHGAKDAEALLGNIIIRNIEKGYEDRNKKHKKVS